MFNLCSAGRGHIMCGPYFPKALLMVIPAAQYVGFPVCQLRKGFFHGAVQLLPEYFIFYRVQLGRCCRVFL